MAPDAAPETERPDVDELSVVQLKFHRMLGPGLLESVYQACLVYELQKSASRSGHSERPSVVYKDVKLDVGFRGGC